MSCSASLFDRQTLGDPNLQNYFFFEGQHLSQETIIRELSPIVARLNVDAERLDDDWENASVELERLSIAEYLEGVGVSGWPYKLFNQVLVSEMGLEMGIQRP